MAFFTLLLRRRHFCTGPSLDADWERVSEGSKRMEIVAREEWFKELGLLREEKTGGKYGSFLQIRKRLIKEERSQYQRQGGQEGMSTTWSWKDSGWRWGKTASGRAGELSIWSHTSLGILPLWGLLRIKVRQVFQKYIRLVLSRSKRMRWLYDFWRSLWPFFLLLMFFCSLGMSIENSQTGTNLFQRKCALCPWFLFSASKNGSSLN